MPRYANGQIPLSDLYILDSGHLTTRTTAIRWYMFRRDVYGETGVWLYITPGANAYRDLPTQHEYRAQLGNGAAWPGTSSHGGTWNGGDAMAYDIANYNAISWATFKRLAEKWGFLVGQITNPPEMWHVIDANPYGASPTAEPLMHDDAAGVWRMEDDMPLTDADIDKLLNYPAYDGGPTISVALKEVHEQHIAVQRSIHSVNPTPLPTDGSVVEIPVRQDNADTNTIVRRQGAFLGQLSNKVDAIAAAVNGLPKA